MITDRLAIGAVAGAHGVRGQFKVKPFTEAPRCLGEGLDLSLIHI